MPDDTHFAPLDTLIAGRFAVDTSQSLPDAGGGVPAFLARDRQAGDRKRVALGISRDASPRLRPLKLLADPIDNLMSPLGHGVAPLSGGKGEGYFIVCTAPPGAPVSASLNRWPDKALLDLVLAPAARVLDALDDRNLTHRAIRTNNVFQAAAGQPVTLGAAWATPPAMHQPAVFESPYSAMCHPLGRGDGSIADDVYALGVLLLTLAGGKLPMAGMDDSTVIRWKLDQGSFAALTRDVTLSPTLIDLLRMMLADDAEQRPLPSALLNAAQSRGRRIAARPAKRSQRPLMLNDIAVFDAPMLAFALLSNDRKATQFLGNGLVTQWLRRGFGDAGLATQIEELMRGRVSDMKSGTQADALLVMRAIGTINPRMPLCWRGVALWPDALASLLSEGIATQSDLLASAEELAVHDIAGAWAAANPRLGHFEQPDLLQQHNLIQGATQVALLRLFYGLNPLLPCRSPAMAAGWVVSMPDLMRFLEHVAETASDSLIDAGITAFIAARADRKLEMQVNALSGTKNPALFRQGELALLRDMQARHHPSPMQSLAKWVSRQLQRDLGQWRNIARREALRLRLDSLAQTGFVSRLLAAAEDGAAQALDNAGAEHAANELAMIDLEVAAIDDGDTLRFTDAERFGQAITGGLGLSTFILVVLSVLLR